MKNKLFVGKFFALLLVFGIMVSACSNGSTDGSKHPNLSYSIQVNNQSGNSRAIVAGDKVELYIRNFEYCEDAVARGLMLIADGDRGMGSKGGILSNAGWYSVDADLAVMNDVNPGPYSSFQVRISKLRVDGIEYSFPPNWWVIFGNPTPTSMGNNRALGNT